MALQLIRNGAATNADKNALEGDEWKIKNQTAATYMPPSLCVAHRLGSSANYKNKKNSKKYIAPHSGKRNNG
jgi:hypothetical protein